MVSARMASIHESTTLKISAMAKKLTASGLDIIDMGVGEPDFNTPKHIVEAGCESIRMGETHYTPTAGIPELRQAIAEKLCDENMLDVTADDVVVTPGAKMADFAAIQALMQEGDECVLIGPSWVSYEPCVAFAGGRVVWGQVDEKFFPLSLDEAITPRTRVILVNSPSNPTGAVFDRKVLEEIRDLACDHDLFVISDEIYEKIIYEGNVHTSPASLPALRHRTITSNGFSKAYAMTGWRVGYLAGPSETIEKVTALSGYTLVCPSSISQKAAYAAITDPRMDDCIKGMVERFDRRRKLVLEAFNGLRGARAYPPQGTFYAWVDISETRISSEQFVYKLLKSERVGVLPGSLFGPRGEGHIRISFATREDQLKEGLEKLRRFILGITPS
jgi:aspartate aminotransferase